VPKEALKNEGGFVTAVLSHEKQVNPAQGAALPVDESDLTGRLFLLPKDSPSTIPPKTSEDSGRPSKPKRTINRKRITYESEFNLNAKTYMVNSAKSGLYVEILTKIIEQFEIAQSNWGRVFVLRFDLHQPFFREDSKHLTAFMRRLFPKLKRRYSFREIGYAWAREQERSKSQHYHFVLFLDGNLIRHSSKISKMIKEAWEIPSGGFHVPTIKRPFHFVSNEEIAQEVIYRVSYLAKTRGKGYRPPQAKDFSCSRMKPPR